MDNPIQNALLKMGSNFLVAAFVPAMTFVVSAFVAFKPVFPQSSQANSSLVSYAVQSGLLLLLLSTVLGFTLYSISTYVYKAFEGYTFILSHKTIFRRIFLKRQMRRFQILTEERRISQKQLEKIKSGIKKEKEDSAFGRWRNKRLNRLVAKQQELERRIYDLTSALDNDFPPTVESIMPTRFGNILCASENYPRRYCIDAVPIWTRLVCATPDQDGIMEKINEANNQCAFLLNGALLGALLFCVSVAFMIYEGFCWCLDKSPAAIGHNVLTLVYLALAVVSLGLARFFYEASLFNVSQFGAMIRTTYDIYRFNLLEALHLELPKNLAAEKKIWMKLSCFMTGTMEFDEEGDGNLEQINFEYIHPPKKPTSGDAS
jgi:hypothetical protein